MSKTVQSPNYKDVLKDIESFYTENSISAYCPWTCTTLNYKPLSVQQIRQFIELQINAQREENQILGVFDSLNHMNKILTDNCIDDNKDILNTLTVLDREALMVQLRAFTKPQIEVVDTHNETIDLNLEETVATIKGKRPNKTLLNKSLSFKYDTGSINLKLSVPTLAKDNTINDFFKKKFKSKLNKGQKELEKIIEKLLSEMYFVELCKYITSITINKGDAESTVLLFDSSSVLGQNMQLLEKLPSNIIGAMSNYIAEVKEYRDTFLSYTNSQKEQVSLEVDANIFAGI